MLKRLFDHLRAVPEPPKGKPGARAYAIGDVHGCLSELDDLLGQIERDFEREPDCQTFLVFLGDLIDRGPDSAGVIERVMTYARPGVRTICLMGNHEEFLLRSLEGEPGVIHDWLDFGGRESIDSYGGSSVRIASLPDDLAAEELRVIIPERHRSFIADFADSFQFGDYLFVHAGVRPGVALARQRPNDLRWIREPFLSDRADHGAVIVHGHTISPSIVALPNRIGIDTGAYRTGVLTAVAIRDDRLNYFQTDPAAPGQKADPCAEPGGTALR